jgi:hypothetical protein
MGDSRLYHILPSVSSIGSFRTFVLSVFPLIAGFLSSYLSMFKNTQLAAEGNRLTKRIKIPLLRVPLAMLAVIADMSIVIY